MRRFTEMLAELNNDALTAHYKLTSDEKNSLLKSIAPISRKDYHNEDIGTRIAFLSKTACLPDALKTKLQSFGTSSNRLGLFFIENLPLNPIIGFEKSTSVSESILLAIGLVIGKPLSYSSQRNGDIVQNLVPQKKDAYKLLGTGSAVELIWHTEDAHTEISCEFIGLLCLRGDPEAYTFVSNVDVSELDSQVVKELSKKQFLIQSDESYPGGHSEIKVSLIAQMDGKLTVRYDPPYTKCPTTIAEEAMNALTDYINSKAVSITLKTGDALIINNKVSIHGRSKFKPRYDETDRWIQRIAIFKEKIPNYLINPSNPYIIKM